MRSVTVAALLSAMVAAPAFAANESLYAGLALGSGKPGITPAAGAALTKNSDLVFGGMVGYMFNQNLAAEVQFTGVGKVTDVTGKTAKGDAFSMAAVGFFPLGSRLNLYAKLGLASTSNKVTAGAANRNASRLGATYGLGVQYTFNSNFGMRFGWDRYGMATATGANLKTNSNADTLIVGLIYNF
ncbi:MAG TPA: porin family protein [Gallionella sp.]|nr:porin family protein [Gallionella sp.]